MAWSGFVVGLLVLAQVPSPSQGSDRVRELEVALRSIIANETAQLKDLVDRLDREGDHASADRVRERIPRPVEADGPTRLSALPEVVPARPEVTASEPWREALRSIQSNTATELFKQAQRAARIDPPAYAMASLCLRAVIDRQPDQREARRLLGYIPHEGGWAKPFAAHKLRDGYVSHPIFGWVLAEWVPHLDRGELPAPLPRGQKKTRWLPSAEADLLRASWSPPWFIYTEHFEIQSNATLAEAITFGRRLEAFHDLFMALLADILGENIALARRFKDPSMTGEAGYRQHAVFYFGSKSEYVDYLKPKQGPQIAQSLGFYEPPKSGGNRRLTAYFFRDPGGQLPVTATLYHEVSHQLLFETAGPNAYTRNAGNYWVFEGLGTYFETVSPQPDGSVEVGGLVGRRMEESIRSLVGRGQLIPLADFVAFDQNAFNSEDQIYLHYQQAMALTVFFMQWHEGAYRDSFLDYVRDAYRGRIKHGAGRSLQDRLGQSYATLDKQFKTFLTNAADRLQGQQAATAQPIPSDAIRTVPMP